MPEKPLLLFPTKSKTAYQKKSGGPDKDLRKPNKFLQSSRITNMFTRVTEAFEKKRLEIQQDADNANPEMVLVFETRGTVRDFFKAVKNIPDLKWLGDFEEEFAATADFNYESDPSMPVTGKLYCVLANNASLRQLRSLWNTWRTQKQNFRKGETSWRKLFDLLYDIRLWGIKDRMGETGILNDWAERLEENQEVIPFELELWFRKSIGQRKIIKERISSLLELSNSKLLSECVIEEIGYHGILIEAPIKIFNFLTDETGIRLFKSNEIMFIRPVGQGILRSEGIPESQVIDEETEVIQQTISPLIALLDGFPMQNHSLLVNRIIVYDPDNFEKDYPANSRIHGTSMSSIILHGDKIENLNSIKSKLVVRPVMKYHTKPNGSGEEFIPENYLTVDLIHRAVKELIEGNNTVEPVAPTVRVINLSLGDRHRQFHNIVSPWAKLLDWLSAKYNILFVVSAGNISENIELENSDTSFEDLVSDPGLLQATIVKLFYSKNRFRTVLSPAESINSLTVGAAHDDSCGDITLGERIELYNNKEFPSPISSMGFGYRRSIKPDILANGGRILFSKRIGFEQLRVLANQSAIAPGIKAAIPSTQGLNGFGYIKGTSCSAALVSHYIAKIYEGFLEDVDLSKNLTQEYFPIVAKAMIVHSSSWNLEASEMIKNYFPNNANKKDLLTRFFGYGKVEPDRMAECTSNRVTIVGFGNIRPEEALIYELPLPDSLSGKVLWRKIVVTLAWFSPINTENQNYRTHKLWFDFPNNEIDQKLKASRAFYDNDTVRRGTVQHEIFYGNRATAYSENTNLNIKVNCKTDATQHHPVSFAESKNIKSVRYSIIVTIEVDNEIGVDIYNEIDLKIKQRIKT